MVGRYVVDWLDDIVGIAMKAGDDTNTGVLAVNVVVGSAWDETGGVAPSEAVETRAMDDVGD
jgi:hypothetical protein